MSYRSKISVNPNIAVQGLQSQIQANIHDLSQIQIDNQVFNSMWNNKSLILFNNTNIAANANLASNPINTLYLEPTQQITFFGGVNNVGVNIFIDISYDASNWFDANFPIIKNSSNDFSFNYHTQAPFIRVRFQNTISSIKVIEKAFASYKYKNIRGKNGTINILDANQSFVTK